jgi:hypothetical protein
MLRGTEEAPGTQDLSKAVVSTAITRAIFSMLSRFDRNRSGTQSRILQTMRNGVTRFRGYKGKGGQVAA